MVVELIEYIRSLKYRRYYRARVCKFVKHSSCYEDPRNEIAYFYEKRLAVERVDSL